MGVQARENVPAKSQVFVDSVVRKRKLVYNNGSVTESQSLVSRTAHYCSRSAIQKMPLVSLGGGKRIRLPSDYSRYVTDSPSSTLSETTRYSTYTEYIEGPFGPPFSDISNSCPWISGYIVQGNSEATSHAMVNALSKIGDQKVEIGTALAEARKTYNMVADASISLFTSYRAARRGEWGKVARALGLSRRDYFSGKSSANKLLALQYGWMPTLRDLYQGYQWFAENRDTPLLLKARGRADRQSTFDGSTTYRTWNGTVNQVSFCGILASVSGEYMRTANQGGLLNPASIAWELVPFSFVLDWWLPIGNVLQAYTDSAGLTFISGYTGTKNEASVEVRARSSPSVPNWELRGTCPVEYFSSTRSKLGSFPRPNVYGRQNWFNTSRGITALALFRNLIR